MKKYIDLEIEIVNLVQEDIITSSPLGDFGNGNYVEDPDNLFEW